MRIPEDHREFLDTTFEPIVSLDSFSERDKKILARYGAWLDGLMNGDIDPFTPEQGRFVDMCSGKARPASEIEEIWQKYRLEVLYEVACLMDKAITTNQFSYDEIRQLFEEVAQQGHKLAADWLYKEGHRVSASSNPPLIDITRHFTYHKFSLDVMDAYPRASGSYGSAQR